MKGGNRAGDNAAATVGTVLRVQHHAVFAKPDCFQRKIFFRAGGDATAATAAAGGVDLRDVLMVRLQSPRSICCHVNSGFVCLRLKG